jgi:DNA-binding transcriptional regulator/RsmH inhibitor MraZ
VFLTSKNRLIIPAQVRHRVEWLGGTSGVIAFAKLEEEGFATVWPWAPKGELVKQRVSKIPKLSEDPTDRALMALAIQSRYVRLSLEPSGRNVLPADLIAHIDPDIRDGAPLCIIGYADHFEFMSQNYWQERRRNELDDVLPDLP